MAEFISPLLRSGSPWDRSPGCQVGGQTLSPLLLSYSYDSLHCKAPFPRVFESSPRVAWPRFGVFIRSMRETYTCAVRLLGRPGGCGSLPLYTLPAAGSMGSVFLTAVTVASEGQVTVQ